jgi:hypothetical protein
MFAPPAPGELGESAALAALPVLLH